MKISELRKIVSCRSGFGQGEIAILIRHASAFIELAEAAKQVTSHRKLGPFRELVEALEKLEAIE